MQIPDDAYPIQHYEGVESDIDLPPVKALPGRGLVVVMVVMPAFAQGHEREEPVISAVVGRLITPATKHVCQGIDAEGNVTAEHCADAESPHEPRPASNQPAEDGQRNNGHEVVSIEPSEFRISGQVLDPVVTGIKVFG